MHLKCLGGTDRGKRRHHDEDAFLIANLDEARSAECLDCDVGSYGVLLAVSDGLGGAPAGEVASRATVHALYEELRADDVRGDEKRSLARVVARANQDVLAAAQRPDRRGMGATLTAGLVRSGAVYLAQVGDSRAYLHRDGSLRQVTKDQSFVQMLVDAGHLTPEQAEHHPQKNVVTQVMGQERPVRADVGHLPLRHGDRLLFCSDGLFNAIDEEAIARLLLDADPVRALIGAANAAGGPDNITVIIAEVAR